MKNRSVFATAGHKFRTSNISQRAQKMITSPIKEMSVLADALNALTGEKIISFGQGIPYFDTPAHIKISIVEALQDPNTARYTLHPGISELRQLIARHLTESRNISNIQSDKEIMVTTGCQEAVACALAVTIDAGDEVLLFSPDYVSHIEQVIHYGGIPQFVPLSERNGWCLDMAELEKMVNDRTKAILFSNPVNPTGYVFTEQEIGLLASFAKKHDLIIITDETYDFLLYDGVRHVSLASLPDVRDRVILCCSFSKKYALTGYRVGYVFADSGIMDHMLKVHDALTICAPAISQKAAIAALAGPQDVSAGFVNSLAQNRELMCAELDRLGNLFEYQKPQGAYYIFAKYKIPAIDSLELALRILNEARVVTVPGIAFGPTGEGYLRFSFACSQETIKEGFARLGQWAELIR